MKVYLFLYPIEEYISSLLWMWSSFSFYGHQPAEVNRLINARYRDRGYQVWWLLFSVQGDPKTPDLSRIFKDIDIREEDILLPCGVDFQTHRRRKVYPKARDIVDQLPKDIEQLVIGGFHQSDCVDKVAACAHSLGIPTFVDEDTTEFFFPRTGAGSIPLVREVFKVSDLFIDDPFSVQLVLESRRDKPWLTQLP